VGERVEKVSAEEEKATRTKKDAYLVPYTTRERTYKGQKEKEDDVYWGGNNNLMLKESVLESRKKGATWREIR